MREVNVPDVPAAAAVIAGLAARYGGLVRAGATPASVAGVSRGGLIYLATPFTRRLPDVGLCGLRDEAAVHVAALAREGVTAVSPVLLSAAACISMPALDPLDDDFWTRWCAPLLRAAAGVVVPDLPGWPRSRGVRFEMEAALARCIPVHFYDLGAP